MGLPVWACPYELARMSLPVGGSTPLDIHPMGKYSARLYF